VTRRKDNARGRITVEDLRQVLAEDRDLLKVIVEEVLQQVLEAEMEEALQAGKSERTASRLGYRSGYYSRTLVTRIGKIGLRVPQDRQGRFRTEVFERYQRSEKALVAAMMEMYLHGVSTRKVKTDTAEGGGPASKGPMGQDDHRRAVRTRVQFRDDQPDCAATR
jgi:putative transposase